MSCLPSLTAPSLVTGIIEVSEYRVENKTEWLPLLRRHPFRRPFGNCRMWLSSGSLLPLYLNLRRDIFGKLPMPSSLHKSIAPLVLSSQDDNDTDARSRSLSGG